MDKFNAVLKGDDCYRTRKIDYVKIKNGLFSYFIRPIYFSILSNDCLKLTYNLHETFGSQIKNGALFDINL